MTTAFYKPESYLLPRSNSKELDINLRASREVSPSSYSPIGNFDVRGFQSVDMTNPHN